MDDTRIIGTIKKVMPAVVSIAIAKHLEDIEREMTEELYSFFPGHHIADKFKKAHKIKIPKELVDPRGMVKIGGGSGFVVQQDGLILTNKHVIADPEAEYTVILSDGRKFQGHVLSRDPINDVAILKIDATGLPIVRLGDAAKLDLGQSVIAIGNALGIFKNTVSLGIVSGLSRAISAQAGPKARPQELRGLIQTDAAINPGNSGGPLIDADGLAVGVNAAVVFGAENIGFAIPINAAKRDLDDIGRYGRIRRPFLGVRYVTIDENLQAKMKLPVAYGAIIVNESPHDPGVTPGGPAAKAGLREKDIILECNTRRVDVEHPIQDFLENLAVGDTVNLLVMRGGKEFRVRVPLSERK